MMGGLPDLAGRTALVTGGTGFIGCRLVERLVLECGARVRVPVRRWSAAGRLARLDPASVGMMRGDVAEAADVEAAMEGCDLAFHCAHDFGMARGPRWQEQANVAATRNVLEAARRRGLRRVVFLSTLLVYGQTPDGDLTEAAPRRRFGGAYANAKLKSEAMALDYARLHALPVTVLQPTAVYGPFGGVWTEAVYRALRTEGVVLVDDGAGLCNAVYVDDLVGAMLLAAVRDEAVGEAFLISGAQPVTWRDFYARHAEGLGPEARLRAMTRQEASVNWRSERQSRSLPREALRMLRGDPVLRKRILRTREVESALAAFRYVVPGGLQLALKQRALRSEAGGPALAVAREAAEPPPPAPAMARFFASRTRVRIDKARERLGYEPAFDFESGMRMTERWARWANVIPAPSPLDHAG